MLPESLCSHKCHSVALVDMAGTGNKTTVVTTISTKKMGFLVFIFWDREAVFGSRPTNYSVGWV